MARFIILSFFVLCLYTNIEAQQANKTIGVFKISAKVLDAVSNEPIEFATITLINDSTKKVLNGSITNKRGSFDIQNITFGNYQLVVQFI